MDVLANWTQWERDERAALHRTEAAEREEEFAALVGRQGRFLYRVAYAVTRNVHDAEDAVQEAFLKVYRTGAWRGMEDEKAYLARVVWRMAVARLRPREAADGAVEVEVLASGDASPEIATMRSDEELRLRRMIDELPEELRQTLVLSALEEMSSREVGVAMGIPEGTVRTRLMRARAELRRRFETGGVKKELR